MNREFWKTFFLLFILLSSSATESVQGQEEEDDCGQEGSFHASDGKEGKRQCYSSKKTTRYVVYDVSPGEGFNLKRDVFVRVAPIIRNLNAMDERSRWVLVLHPWGNLPHWITRDYYAWRIFFDTIEIENYIPAIEFFDFMEEYGLDNDIDYYYQLQQFPLNSRVSMSWTENIREVKCEVPLRFKRTNPNTMFSGLLWQYRLNFHNATCLGLKGDSLNLAKFLIYIQPRAVFLDKAEAILWDHYGGREWWQARKSLKFADHLVLKSIDWIEAHFPPFKDKDWFTSHYMGLHLRRRDFVEIRKNQPSLSHISQQAVKALMANKINNVFIATDGTDDETAEVSKMINNFMNGTKTTIVSFYCLGNLSDGECAIIDQIICAWSQVFIGTADSTFTLRIFEERELLGVPPEFNYQVFCPGNLLCSKSTRWPVM